MELSWIGGREGRLLRSLVVSCDDTLRTGLPESDTRDCRPSSLDPLSHISHNRTLAMMRIVTFAIHLSIAACCWAFPPEARITGPTKGTPGDILILDASDSKAQHFNWLVDASDVKVPNADGTNVADMIKSLRGLGFKVEEPDRSPNSPITHLVLDDGKKLLLASYPGTWRVSLAVGSQDGVSQLPWKVSVSGDTSPPPPPPNGDDNDPPPPPPLDTDLSQLTKQSLAKVPTQYRGPQKDIRESLEDLASRWKTAGSIEAMDILLTNSVAASLRPLGSNASKWGPFLTDIDRALENLKTKGVTLEQYGQAIGSIANGLK